MASQYDPLQITYRQALSLNGRLCHVKAKFHILLHIDFKFLIFLNSCKQQEEGLFFIVRMPADNTENNSLL